MNITAHGWLVIVLLCFSPFFTIIVFSQLVINKLASGHFMSKH